MDAAVSGWNVKQMLVCGGGVRDIGYIIITETIKYVINFYRSRELDFRQARVSTEPIENPLFGHAKQYLIAGLDILILRFLSLSLSSFNYFLIAQTVKR